MRQSFRAATGSGPRSTLLALATAAILLAWGPSPAGAQDTPPYPPSSVDAGWVSPRYESGTDQTGDILPTSWSTKGLYTMINDGSVQGRSGRNVFAKIWGTPPNLGFQRIGQPEQLDGHRYSNGFTSVNGVFYATVLRRWNWQGNGPFKGLLEMAYSLNHGRTWQFAGRSFPWWQGDLNFVQEGEDAPNPNGQIYAIANDREFNSSYIWLGHTGPRIGKVTRPGKWRWRSQPIVSWPGHITYPRMTYDPQLGQYLLSFSYSYYDTIPQIWKGGAQLVVMAAPKPWGPFGVVFQQDNWGPSNGYGGTFPIPWQGPLSNGTQVVWMVWAANFAGCLQNLDCSGKYGVNMEQLELHLPSPSVGPLALRKR